MAEVKNSNILGVYVQSGSTATASISEFINGTDADYTAHSYTGVADGDYVYLHGGSATFINVNSETPQRVVFGVGRLRHQHHLGHL